MYKNPLNFSRSPIKSTDLLNAEILQKKLSLSDKYPYSEFFWSLFSKIWTEYLYIFSPNIGKYSPEKLQILTLFMHCLAG